ncbi:hypothetical protein [Xanthobacter flavus]|uniref:hypothetical protein n=1 Tax=Xanthobacter flavus TaxID=281 RepID=UPI001AE93BE9|nr:hypothetical protein [Xanthobacter flavus]MBP2147933.1 hypothetical protein [Xanthobacter flavus]
MSFSRMALSLAVLEALCPKAANGNYPTPAGGNVYRERIGPLDDLAEDAKRQLVVVVGTGRDDGTANSPAGPPYLRVIEVEIAIFVRVFTTFEDDAGEETPFWTVPVTDAEADDALSVLEHRIRDALLFGESGRIFRSLRQKLPSIVSTQEREPEEGVKLAARRVVLNVQVPDECPLIQADAEGVDRLPTPLRGVAEALIAAGYAPEIFAALGTALPVQPAPVPFTGITLDIDISQPSDGTADITADVAIPQG